MFGRRVIGRARSFSRPFSSSNVIFRAPSIRDIVPDSAAEFNARQKEFREKLEEARKQRERQESQSVDTSASSSSSPISFRDRFREYALTAPCVSNASAVSSGVAKSFWTRKVQTDLFLYRVLGEDQTPDPNQPKRGPLSSLIYGTKEGQQLDKDIERSFSQVLARGKYVHSIVFHEVKPDRVDEYVDLVGGWYPRMASMPENKVNLVGSWRTQVGDNDTFSMNRLIIKAISLM